MFERADWKDAPSSLEEPWKPLLEQVQAQRAQATEAELKAKPWHQTQDSVRPDKVILHKPFYNWLAGDSTKKIFLCNQGVWYVV